MTKKRQQDFSKVQLKPGRMLSKRKNITATHFKAKKIIMPKEKPVKLKAELTIGDSLQKIKSTGNEKDKIGNLTELSKLIPRHSDTIHTYLSQIFDTVLDFLRDPHDGIRNAALKVFVSLLTNTTDLQLNSYADLLNNNISAIMKNPNPKISSASLILLDCMLKNHPDLICYNISILFDLLPTERRHYTRKMSTEKEAFQYSERGEINALGHINAFLRNMLKIKDEVEKHEDEAKDVYMKSNETLHLQIYSAGGLQPVDIEEAYSKQFGHQTDPFDEVEKLCILIDTLLKLIPSYFCQIIGSESNADDNTFRCDPIADLSILIQLLCNIAELAEKISYSDAEDDIVVFLKERIFCTQRKRFPFELHTVISPASVLKLAFLNNTICFLYMKYLSSNPEYENDVELLESYLSRFFVSEKSYSLEMKCKCSVLFVKMIQLYENKTIIPKVIYYVLRQFISLLKSRINHPDKKMIIDLLFNMSLLPGYKFWVDSEPMELWYEWLLSHLKENIGKLDKKLIRIILRIAKKRQPSFMNLLDFAMVKSLLKCRHEDGKEAAVFLLHNMDLDHDFLKKIYNIIVVDSFPKKIASKLIYMLHARFSQYPADKKPYIDYIEFLINIALDVHNFSNSKILNYDANRYTRAFLPLRQNCSLIVLPSLRWKEHSMIFKVCLSCLRNLPLEPVSLILTNMLSELMHKVTSIPIHCALSILKLHSLGITDEDYSFLVRDLKFSCFITTSVLTQMRMDDEWYKWNVCELMNNMVFTETSAIEYLEILEQGKYGKPDGLVVYHILRVLKVFASKGLFDIKCQDTVDYVVQIVTHLVEERCYDKSMKHQPLYIQLYNYFVKYYSASC